MACYPNEQASLSPETDEDKVAKSR